MSLVKRILLFCMVMLLFSPASAGYAVDLQSILGKSQGGNVDQAQIAQWVGVQAADIGNVTLNDGQTGTGFLYENVSADAIQGCVDKLSGLGFTARILDTNDGSVQYSVTKDGQQLLLVVYAGNSSTTINLAVVFVGGTESMLSKIENMKTDTLIADVNGKTTEFEINISQHYGTGQMVDFISKDVRGVTLEGFSLFLPGVIYAGDVIDSKSYNAARYGLCGMIYYNRREASAQEAYNTNGNCDYMARITYDSNYSTVDDFFNPSMKPVMLPNSRASFMIYCDYMSADGYTYGGRFEALLIRGTDGKELTVKNGFFKFSVR